MRNPEHWPYKLEYGSWVPPGVNSPKMQNDIMDLIAEYMGYYPMEDVETYVTSSESELCLGVVAPLLKEPEAYEIADPPRSGELMTEVELQIFEVGR